MKIFITVLLVFLSSTSMANQHPTVKIAIQPTFGAHQQIGYEIIRRLPGNAKKNGINDLQIETVKTKSSIDGNIFLINGQIDVNVGSISSFLILNSKSPGQSKLLSAVGHYRYFLLCQPGIGELRDVLKTKIALSSRNTLEAHTLKWLAKSKLGDPDAFEKNIIVMPRSQIYQLFQAKSPDIQCVMTGSPLQNQLIEDFGLKTVAQSDASKGFAGSYNAYWASAKWINANPRLARAFVETAVQVIKDYNKNPVPIMENFIATDRMQTTAQTLIKNDRINSAQWHADFRGAQFFSDFLYDIGYLSENRPMSVDELIFAPQLLK